MELWKSQYSTSMNYGHILLGNTLPCWVTAALRIPVRNKYLRVPGGRAQLAQEQLVLGSEAQSFQHWQLNRNQNLAFNWCWLLTPNSCWVSSSKKEGPCLSGRSYSQLRWVCCIHNVIFSPPSISNPRNVRESKSRIIKTSPCLSVT